MLKLLSIDFNVNDMFLNTLKTANTTREDIRTQTAYPNSRKLDSAEYPEELEDDSNIIIKAITPTLRII